MKIRDEIEMYSKEEHKPVLRWLFEQNLWYCTETVCKFDDKGLHAKRIWHPSPAGQSLYEANLAKRRLQVVQELLRELIVGEELKSQTLRDKAYLLSTEFNPEKEICK
jgi:hypothetical protein